ncbi:40865_t:CDS:2 [Gigaspora margarita]|uniref:40865_t:CDS:1 n=1 Tax=Gigaspora margarita TaxID=4874 RepID=A0ABN7V7B0_GIGMA|nr:40865_t:CDS:2 [Gigaspora margarita]
MLFWGLPKTTFYKLRSPSKILSENNWSSEHKMYKMFLAFMIIN